MLFGVRKSLRHVEPLQTLTFDRYLLLRLPGSISQFPDLSLQVAYF